MTVIRSTMFALLWLALAAPASAQHLVQTPAKGPLKIEPLVLTEAALAARPDLRARIEADHAHMLKANTSWCAAHPNLQPSPIAVHPDHPQAADMPFYNSSADWRPFSSQLHVLHADGVLSHTHVETCSPDFGKIPIAWNSLPIPGRIQFFHTKGRLSGISGDLQPDIQWAAGTPLVKVGDPSGLVIYNFLATYNLRGWLHNGSGGPVFTVPENGWFAGSHLTVYTDFDDGIGGNNEMVRALYSQGDPNALPDPRLGEAQGFGISFMTASRTSAGYPGDLESLGVANVDFKDVFLPIAPLRHRMMVPVQSYAYARSPNYSAPELDRAQFIVKFDFHAGNMGTTVQDIDASNGANANMVIWLDPAAFGEGDHKWAAIWKQNTGPGNAFFGSNHEVWSLAVFDLTVPAGPYTPPPASPNGTIINRPGQQIIDNNGTVWMISGRALTRNGLGVRDAWGDALSFSNNTISLLGLDGLTWYVIEGTGTPPPPPVPVVNCQLTRGTPVLQAPGLWMVPYTETKQPSNGGMTCDQILSRLGSIIGG